MASTSLYAPQVSATQPAFVYNTNETGEVKISFSFSAYNTIHDISGILVSVVNPNVSSLDGQNNMVKDGNYIFINVAAIQLDIITKKYYFNLNINENILETLTLNQYYQVQLYFVDKIVTIFNNLVTDSQFEENKDNISAPSQITLIYPIANHTVNWSVSDLTSKINNRKVEVNIELDYGDGNPIDEIEHFSLLFIGTDDFNYEDENIKNYLNNGKAKAIIEEVFPDQEITVKLKYTTVHGYSREDEQTINYSVVANEEDLEDINLNFNSNISAIEGKYPNDAKDYYLQKSLDGNIWQTIGYKPSATLNASFQDINILANQKYWYRVLVSSGGENLSWISQRYSSMPIEVDFEDIFLSDEKVLLAIRYNPNITGFKWVVQENITNTIGGVYPIVRRNGDTYYRQFTLGGTLFAEGIEYAVAGSTPQDSRGQNGNISDLVNHLGTSDLILFAEPTQLKASTKRGVETEARHLMEAFLTNGKPKLFRSAEEGNMIVYLSNVSFTPNRQLGRHVYDFSATATEFCGCTNENLEKYNLIAAASYDEPNYTISFENGNPVTRVQ